jgi:hypothetical protein
MGMQYDVKAAYLTGDDTVFAGPARVKGLVISPNTSAGGLSLKNGGSGGSTKLQFSWPANTTPTPFTVVIPPEGVRFETDVYADVTNVTSITVFYG